MMENCTFNGCLQFAVLSAFILCSVHFGSFTYSKIAQNLKFRTCHFDTVYLCQRFFHEPLEFLYQAARAASQETSALKKVTIGLCSFLSQTGVWIFKLNFIGMVT